jgi:hypothetical protein
VSAEPKLKLMVASTVYNFQDQLNQICAVLSGFGYEVWNSHIGTIPVHPGFSNRDNCVAAARNSDAFLGIVRPVYGSGVIDDRSIMHDECREAVRLNKPRWFLVHRDVTIARQLLKSYIFRKNGTRTKFKLKKNSVIDDLRVIDLYHDAIQNDIPRVERAGNWAQEFYRMPEVLSYLDSQLKDTERVRRICEDMRRP